MITASGSGMFSVAAQTLELHCVCLCWEGRWGGVGGCRGSQVCSKAEVSSQLNSAACGSSAWAGQGGLSFRRTARVVCVGRRQLRGIRSTLSFITL